MSSPGKPLVAAAGKPPLAAAGRPLAADGKPKPLAAAGKPLAADGKPLGVTRVTRGVTPSKVSEPEPMLAADMAGLECGK